MKNHPVGRNPHGKSGGYKKGYADIKPSKQISKTPPLSKIEHLKELGDYSLIKECSCSKDLVICPIDYVKSNGNFCSQCGEEYQWRKQRLEYVMGCKECENSEYSIPIENLVAIIKKEVTK